MKNEFAVMANTVDGLYESLRPDSFKMDFEPAYKDAILYLKGIIDGKIRPEKIEAAQARINELLDQSVITAADARKYTITEAGKELEIDYEEAKSEDPFWFLPSIVALRCFLKQYKDNADANIERGKFLLEFLILPVIYKNALATKIDRSGNVDDDYYRENKENAYYARQACHAQ